MATRYSGRYTIKITFVDSHDQFECLISHDAYKRMRDMDKLECVRPPRALDQAVDSPASYDSAARAALAFGIAGGKLTESEIDFDDTGIVVSRKCKIDDKGRKHADHTPRAARRASKAAL